MAEQTIEKKIIRLQTPTMSKPLALKWKPEMDDLNIRDILEVVAKQFLEKSNDRAQADAIKGLAERDIIHNGTTRNSSTKVKDLTFDFRSTDKGSALVADITFNVPASAGL
jgi:hypothetical protein